jgi:hypothetical protein
VEVSTVLRRGSLAVETSRSVGCSVSSKLSVGLLREAWDALCLPGFSLQLFGSGCFVSSRRVCGSGCFVSSRRVKRVLCFWGLGFSVIPRIVCGVLGTWLLCVFQKRVCVLGLGFSVIPGVVCGVFIGNKYVANLY